MSFRKGRSAHSLPDSGSENEYSRSDYKDFANVSTDQNHNKEEEDDDEFGTLSFSKRGYRRRRQRRRSREEREHKRRMKGSGVIFGNDEDSEDNRDDICCNDCCDRVRHVYRHELFLPCARTCFILTFVVFCGVFAISFINYSASYEMIYRQSSELVDASTLVAAELVQARADFPRCM